MEQDFDDIRSTGPRKPNTYRPILIKFTRLMKTVEVDTKK